MTVFVVNNIYKDKKDLIYSVGMDMYISYTVIDLITAHAPISAQSSNLVVFRLQQVYFLSTSL